MKALSLAALALTAAPAALAAPTAPEADDATRFIVNGQEERGYPSVVALTFQFGAFSQAFCTGSLITPNLVLSAGHCTEEVARQYGVQTQQLLQVAYIAFGPDAANPNKSVQFKDVYVHPDYGNSFQGPTADIEVIELVEPVTNVKPVWFATEGLDDVAGEDVRSVGYGVTSSAAQNSSGTKRSAILTVSNVDNQFLYSDASRNEGNTNVCSGDSGGPQYHEDADGNRVQWAVHSFVFGAGGDPCRGASGSTRTDTYADFILDVIEDVHGTTDRCEIYGEYEDRICSTDCAQEDPICVADLDGDGEVTDEEFELVDRDGDGQFTEEEVEKALKGGGCDTTGGGLAGFGVMALVGLLARRRD